MISNSTVSDELVQSENTNLKSVTINGEQFFQISDFDSIRPFFMSIVSDSNHWMFISSNGGVSAGRKNAEFSLFPYTTDDKITELSHTTGSKTIFQILNGESEHVWEPFCDKDAIRFNVSRNLYKNVFGNKIIFEEINHDLEVTFSYEWNSSDEYGFVKKSKLTSQSNSVLNLRVLDGLQNILPASVVSDLQTKSSNLLDAYKRSELVKETGLGIYALSAIPVDKAEPSEALKANVAWSLGVEGSTYLLSSMQLDIFRAGKAVTEEYDVKGEKGGYFIQNEITLNAGTDASWVTVANVNLDHSAVISLNESIKEDSSLLSKIEEDISAGTERLKDLVASSDGFQTTADELKDARHYSNVLFNIMRGGIFDDGYNIEKVDFSKYLKNANNVVFARNSALLNSLPEVFTVNDLADQVVGIEDADLERLCKEYLPLKFSRRHGDPSRPWNRFSINTKDELDGSKILDYEGNWRDIFQNWEALVHSYPSYIEGMIFKFLNSSTFDGYNPYRVTKGGFDWEIIEPDDPWSYIGYWGDHQIIYLLKFLEFYSAHQPDSMANLFGEDVFVYANVPYRIKPYKDIVINPKDTIEFDLPLDEKIREQVEALGADGALLSNHSGSIHRVNFIEKILATVLSKVSNFIPEAGIWMNTQRPEWNDANNALVGNGVSMVTLYYLRRFLRFFEPILDANSDQEVAISKEMATFFNAVSSVLTDNKDVISTSISDSDRKTVTDGLGIAGSYFRDSIYENGFSGEKESVSLAVVADTFKTAAEYLEQSIEANKRVDALYHAYNIMTYSDSGISVSYLDEMLEGQVAVLSSGYLQAEESLEVLESLRNSALYRQDQNSYILYPNKELKGFLQRNSIPKEAASSSKLFTKLIESGDRRIVSQDINGGFHFNGDFKNADYLAEGLDSLSGTEFADLASKEREFILQIFEDVFNHKAFTGRSGTFYGYEGLGSIYWHMVSKLYLAVYEICHQAKSSDVDDSVFAKLANHFYEIGEGIGVHKSPELYGAFPTDPYSHTPYHRGAQQPGMTGQVKEDILARYGELGLEVRDGTLSFNPILLRKSEFEHDAEIVSFTICEVPVEYKIGDSNEVIVSLESGVTEKLPGLSLSKAISKQMFDKSGALKSVTVMLTEDQLR